MLAMFLAAAILDVGSQKQLFIDHKFIESAEGIRLTVNPPYQTREKLVVIDAPWERGATMGSYSTVIQENGRIRLFYDVRAGKAEPGRNPPFMGVAYAESADGLRFTKPVLNLVEWNGSRANNLILPDDPTKGTLGGGSIWRDDNPNVAADARYKSWSKYYAKPGAPRRGPHLVWKSPDGLHWTPETQSVMGLRAADTQPSWFWDPRIGRYVAYSREWVRDRATGFGARMASYNESDDMLHWDSVYFSLGPDERDQAAMPAMVIDTAKLEVKGEDVLPQRELRSAAGSTGEDQVLTPSSPLDFYGPGVFPYEGVYLALIPVFHHWRGSSNGAWPSTGDIQLAVSRDGRHFFRPGDRKPYLTTGRDGAWDSKWIYPVLRPVRMGDELWIYYFGTNHDHAGRLDAKATREESAISRAVLRLDGFVSADADYEGGALITPPLRFEGSKLELNLDTGAGGWARVELLDASGKPIPGFTMPDADELNGNDTGKVVTWRGKSDVGALAGKAVRMRIRMRSAKLYAFQFR
jgi:hypothetical protein